MHNLFTKAVLFPFANTFEKEMTRRTLIIKREKVRKLFLISSIVLEVLGETSA